MRGVFAKQVVLGLREGWGRVFAVEVFDLRFDAGDPTCRTLVAAVDQHRLRFVRWSTASPAIEVWPEITSLFLMRGD